MRITNVEEISDMQGDNDVYSKCQVGSKDYANGETFSPLIGPFGKYQNVICVCKVTFWRNHW